MMTANDFEQELNRILDFWSDTAFDKTTQRFFGRIADDNKADATAPLGVVLHARLLWTFSAAYIHTSLPIHLERATSSYVLLQQYFLDREYGGYYWSVTATGEPLDTQKKIYALAFVLYGLSAYYCVSKEEDVLEEAKAVFELIEKRSYDPVNGGYFDAFMRDWQHGEDLRLSAKDENASKTMNTHLHVLEAYTSLYRVWPNSLLAQRIAALLALFHAHIIRKDSFQQVLFFSREWHPESDIISYGHDIEASWLLVEAAEALNDTSLSEKINKLAVAMARSTLNGIDETGGLVYEFHPSANHIDDDKHWWVAAEGVVGFYNAWEISRDAVFLQAAKKLWTFIQKNLLDLNGGEWYWGVHQDATPMKGEDKAGFWKCPYHNSRCCMEMMRRMRRLA